MSELNKLKLQYLDGKEASTRDVDTMSSLEVPDCCTDGGFQLQNPQIALALFIGGNGFLVGNDFHLEFVIIDDALDGLQIKPDVVCVEVFKLFDALEFLDVVRGDLGNFQETDGSLIVDDGATLDVGLGLVGQFHNVLGLSLDHVVEEIQVDDGAEIVDVADKDVFLATGDQGVEGAAVDEGIKDIAVAGRVPAFYG
jgi:hypothetical protein